MKFHEAVRIFKRREGEFHVKPMRVAGGEGPAAQALKLRMGNDAFHQEFAQATAAMRFENKNVSEIGIRGIVGDDAGKADLCFVFKYAEAEGIFDGAQKYFTRNAGSPYELARKS